MFNLVILKVFLFLVISIYMKYLSPLFDCYRFDGEFVELKENVKYKILESDHRLGLIFTNRNNYVLDLNKKSKNILEVKIKHDSFYFLLHKPENSVCLNNFKYNSAEISVCLSSQLTISYNLEVLCEIDVDGLNYSHHEFFGDFCLLFFEGERNFVVVLKGKDVCFCSHYDECNATDKEIYFMCKKMDSLNHGEVFRVEQTSFERYLVYLDNEELCLKDEFIPMVFLDCVLAKNFKYCNALLDDKLKLENATQIENFFPSFTRFFPISSNEIILINKNTLAGIFEFTIKDSKINNIILLQNSC